MAAEGFVAFVEDRASLSDANDFVIVVLPPGGLGGSGGAAGLGGPDGPGGNGGPMGLGGKGGIATSKGLGGAAGEPRMQAAGGAGGKPPPGYGSHIIDAVHFLASEPILPGATLQVTAVIPASMMLTKLLTIGAVELLFATVDVDIGPQVSGTSEVTITGGNGQFDAYVWEGEPVRVSDFEITGGSASIDWGSGAVTGQMKIHVVAAGFMDIKAVAFGSGQIDFGSNTIILSLDSGATEFGISVPALGASERWIALALIALLGASILFVQRRSRELP